MKLCDEAGEKFGGPSKFNLIGFFGPPCMRKEPRSLTDENNNQMPYNLLFFLWWYRTGNKKFSLGKELGQLAWSRIPRAYPGPTEI